MVETYLDCFLAPEIYIIPNFMKIVRVVLEIYESCVHGQRESSFFYKVEIYLDRLLVPEICVKPNFVKLVSAVLDINESNVQGQTDIEAIRFFTKLRRI